MDAFSEVLPNVESFSWMSTKDETYSTEADVFSQLKSSQFISKINPQHRLMQLERNRLQLMRIRLLK